MNVERRAMPLSEHEQRILADIEARLRADDPRFADTVGSATVSGHLRRRLRWSILGFLVGFVLLFVGLRVHLIWGVVGFGVMLTAAYQGLTVGKRLASSGESASDAAANRSAVQRYLGRHDDER